MLRASARSSDSSTAAFHPQRTLDLDREHRPCAFSSVWRKVAAWAF